MAHVLGQDVDLGLAEDIAGHGAGLHHLGLLGVAPAGDDGLGVPELFLRRVGQTSGVYLIWERNFLMSIYQYKSLSER